MLLRLGGQGDMTAPWSLGSAELDGHSSPPQEGTCGEAEHRLNFSLGAESPNKRHRKTRQVGNHGAAWSLFFLLPTSVLASAYLQHLSVLIRIKIIRILKHLYL